MFRKRIIAWFSIFVICFSMLPSTHAEYISKNTNRWEWILHSLVKSTSGVDFVGPAVQCIAGKLEGDICEMSEDGYHYGDHVVWVGDGEYKDGQPLAKVICKYCNKQFNALVSDYQQSYDAQVAELPATGYNSAGRLIWQPTVADIYYSSFELKMVSGNTSGYFKVKKLPYKESFSSGAYYLISSSANGTGLEFVSSGGLCWFYVYFDTYLKVPISGSYRYDKMTCSYDILLETGSRLTRAKSISSGKFIHSDEAGKLPFSFSSGDLASAKIVSYGTASVPFPVMEIIPDSSIGGTSDTTYNINSRPTSITGDYGIIGDNGQIIKVEGDKIVNETNNTYINPATGTTDTITDWSYDYSTRTYTLTLGGGTTTTVTYGDENVVIKEGDTTYNVYYLVNGSGSENPAPGPDVPDVCDHTWTETSRTDPTCITAGKVTSTCSKCNQTKTETIPATGHSWVVDRTVQTTYDEEGNLLQQGYTIYSCSVCGEQYKDMEGTGPPGQEEEKSIWEKIGDLIGTIAGGFLGLIEAVLGKLLDALVSLAEMLMGKLKTVVETVLSIFDEVPALFGGFLDFLGAIFPFLPPEITTILTFGVIAIIFIGILKAVRR